MVYRFKVLTSRVIRIRGNQWVRREKLSGLIPMEPCSNQDRVWLVVLGALSAQLRKCVPRWLLAPHGWRVFYDTVTVYVAAPR